MPVRYRRRFYGATLPRKESEKANGFLVARCAPRLASECTRLRAPCRRSTLTSDADARRKPASRDTFVLTSFRSRIADRSVCSTIGSSIPTAAIRSSHPNLRRRGLVSSANPSSSPSPSPALNPRMITRGASGDSSEFATRFIRRLCGFFPRELSPRFEISQRGGGRWSNLSRFRGPCRVLAAGFRGSLSRCVSRCVTVMITDDYSRGSLRNPRFVCQRWRVSRR